MHIKGLGSVQDGTEALQWFLQAANSDHTIAQVNAGISYYEGKGGVKQNYKQTPYYFEKAASHGDATAQNYMGRVYQKGAGVEQDYKVALDCRSRKCNCYVQYW
jgi:TPR repeat protein